MITLYVYGEIDDDYILSHSGPLKAFREECQIDLDRLQEQKARAMDLENVAAQLETYYTEIRGDVSDLTHDQKRALLSLLKVKITDTVESAVVPGAVDLPESASYNYH